jgi:hypothetical protein
MMNPDTGRTTPKDAIEYTQTILSIIHDAQKKRKAVNVHGINGRDVSFLHQHNTLLNVKPEQPYVPILAFGDLDNPNDPCKITLLAVSQDAGKKGEDIPLLYGMEILFEKATAKKLLSKVKPGETIEVNGNGTHVRYAKTRTPDSDISENPLMNFNIRTPVTLALSLGLSKNSRQVVFGFNTEETDELSAISHTLTFEKKSFLGISKLSSSTGIGKN